MLSFQLFAEPQMVKACSSEWDGTINADGTGLYMDILREALAPITVNLELFPWARARLLFEHQKCDILLPENRFDLASEKPKTYLDSYPIHAIYNTKRLPNYQDELLKTKKIGWVRGYGFETLLSHQINFFEFNSAAIGYKVLSAGRIDIFLDYMDHWEETCEASGVDCKQLEIAKTDVIESVYPVFQKNNKGRRLAQKWDDSLKVLYEKGFLNAKFLEYGYNEYTGPTF